MPGFHVSPSSLETKLEISISRTPRAAASVRMRELRSGMLPLKPGARGGTVVIMNLFAGRPRPVHSVIIAPRFATIVAGATPWPMSFVPVDTYAKSLVLGTNA